MMLEVSGLAAGYQGADVIRDVDFHVDSGEAVMIIGSNGAGKTTLFRSVLGLLAPSSGAVRFEGSDIVGMPAQRIARLGVSFVPAERHLFPRMTVQENLDLGAYPRRARAGMSDSLQWVYRLFPIIKERRNQAAGTLSGGEQQMLAIGRALMSRPNLLMLDEPSLGLSPLLTIEIFKLVEDIRREGVTVLLVEQNVYQALKVSDRAYVLETGRVTMCGQSGQLLADEGLRRSYLGL